MDATAVTAITNAVDFATIITGIGVIGAAVAVLYIAIKGGSALLGFLRRQLHGELCSPLLLIRKFTIMDIKDVIFANDLTFICFVALVAFAYMFLVDGSMGISLSLYQKVMYSFLIPTLCILFMGN